MKTLAIIGSHPRTRAMFTEWDNPDYEIWMFNEAISGKHNEWAKRADVIFQMHVPAIWRNPGNRNDPGHFSWLTTQNNVDVYMQDAYPDVPMAKKYLKDEILEMLNNDPDHFLSSSVAEAMALAAHLNNYKRIEIYGVAMETNTEYQWQREGVAFWKGFLMGRGIDVYFADRTFECLMYGYEGEVSLPYETFVKRIEETLPQVEKLDAEYLAAAKMTSRIVEEYIDRDASKEVGEAIAKQLEISQKLGTIAGAMQENERYKMKADKMRDAAEGEFLFSRQEFESAAKTLQDSAQGFQTQVNTLSGQGELVHGSIINAAKNSPKRRKLLDAYKMLLDRYLKTHNMAMIHAGASAENFRYMAILDKGIRAAGGVKSEEVLLEAMKNG